jgi:NAD(P)-dependent dehydrogenase (short-subunit alcohol dehydrogenase family)
MTHALVIGGSDGIGLAVARQLLDAGCRVTTASRRPSPIQHERHASAVLDVRSPSYRVELATLVDAQGPLEVCVYCAGIGGRLDETTLEPEYDVFAVNLLGAVATGTVVLPRFVTARSGRFVVLSSLADTLISPLTPSYDASKAGLSSWLASMALAMRPHGVTVTNVRFGFVDTKMAKSESKPFMMTVDRAASYVLRAIERRPRVLSRPFLMAALVTLLSFWLRLRILFGA